jgi:hypothetical protein
MTEQEKNKLAQLNGYTNERYTDMVKENIKDKNGPLGMVVEDEVALARKMLKKVFDLVVKLHGKEIADEVIAEFAEYNEKVEKIKAEAKRVLELG